MRVVVNDEQRELHVYDRASGVDFAQTVVCAQDQLEKNMYGEFVLSEEEYDFWTKVLAKQQQSEDLYYELQQVLDKQEIDNYIYEETKYITTITLVVDTEYLSLVELKKAVDTKDTAWFQENDMPKAAKAFA